MAAVLLACLACTDAWARPDAPDIARSSRQLLQGALLASYVRSHLVVHLVVHFKVLLLRQLINVCCPTMGSRMESY